MHCTIMARLLYRRISTRGLVQGSIYIWRQEVWCRPSLGHLTLNKSQFALNPARLELNHHDHAITHMHCVKRSIYIWRQDVWRKSGRWYLTLNKRDVHVVLVSLLANQLSGQFLIFFGQPKKNWPVSATGQFYLSTLLIFFSSLDIRAWP